MPLTTAEVNAAVDFAASRIQAVNVNTGDPGSTGANESSGSRKALSFAAASNTDATAVEVTIDVPAGTYTHYSLWSAVTGGTFRGGNPLLNAAGTPESATFASAGQLKITVVLDGSTS